MDIVNKILTAIATLVSIGLLFLYRKYDKLKHQGIANQELEKGEERYLINAERLIAIYKKTLEDEQIKWDKEKSRLERDIEDLKSKLAESEKISLKQELRIKDQSELLEKYLKEVNSLKLELDSLKNNLVR